MVGHLKQAANYAKRKLNFTYYCYHGWISMRAGFRFLGISFLAIIHGVFPFIYKAFQIARMIVVTVNQIRDSIPGWEGWEEIDNYEYKHNEKEVK